jgi:sulfate transport system substrate-binding protein
LVDKNVDKRGTRKAAEQYLKFLYASEAQEIIARNYFRPRDDQIRARNKNLFRAVPLFTIDRNFGGWAKAQSLHFKDGGLFDQIYEAAKR